MSDDVEAGGLPKTNRKGQNMLQKVRSRKAYWIWTVVLIGANWACADSVGARQDAPAQEIKLRVGYAQSEDEAKAELRQVMSQLRNLQDWESRADKIRQGIQIGRAHV